MKQLLFFLLIFSCVPVFGQRDKFQWNVNLSYSNITYLFDSIVPAGMYYSNQSWNDGESVHSVNSAHRIYDYNCNSFVLHGGFSLPLLKGERISLGIKPSVGLGFLASRGEPDIEQSAGSITFPSEDARRLRHLNADFSLSAYMRINLDQYVSAFGNVTFYGGFRSLSSYDKYTMPVAGISIGDEKWSVAVEGHFATVTYYRAFSNGQREIARQMKDLGSISIHYCF